eukprot:3557364-Amphidinium_carterae.1
MVRACLHVGDLMCGPCHTDSAVAEVLCGLPRSVEQLRNHTQLNKFPSKLMHIKAILQFRVLFSHRAPLTAEGHGSSHFTKRQCVLNTTTCVALCNKTCLSHPRLINGNHCSCCLSAAS